MINFIVKMFLSIAILFVISQLGFMKQPQYYEWFDNLRSEHEWVRKGLLGWPIRILMKDKTIKCLGWLIKILFVILLWWNDILQIFTYLSFIKIGGC